MSEPITAAEIQQLFGETMPLVAVELLWSSPDTMNIGEVRARLREIAQERDARAGDRFFALSQHVTRAALAGRSAGMDVADVLSALGWAMGELVSQTTAVTATQHIEATAHAIEAGFAFARQRQG